LDYPPLVYYATIDEYKTHFEAMYCQDPIDTFDAIPIRFRKDDFDHAFYESSRRDGQKDVFSSARSKRIDWIKYALQDPTSELYEGWDNKRRVDDKTRRVVLVQGDYVVVVRLRKTAQAITTGRFVTAYVVDSTYAIAMIRSHPKWKGL